MKQRLLVEWYLIEISLGLKVTTNKVMTKDRFGYFCRFVTRALSLKRISTFFKDSLVLTNSKPLLVHFGRQE